MSQRGLVSEGAVLERKRETQREGNSTVAKLMDCAKKGKRRRREKGKRVG